MSAVLLQAQGLRAAYGASQVLFGIDFEIRAGEVMGLLGRNGMGKTTLIRSLLGIKSPQAGSVRFEGAEINGHSSDKIARMGLAVVPEGRQVFPNLSVDEHLTAFAARRNGSAQPWTPESVYALFPRLAERKKNMGNQLSGGEQQMLAIGRALVTNPKLLILDEATEGLAPLIREEIWQCLAPSRADPGGGGQIREPFGANCRSAFDPGARQRGLARHIGGARSRPQPVAPLSGRVMRADRLAS
jgi:branched-chain amino acid transport system ATP-binding protein